MSKKSRNRNRSSVRVDTRDVRGIANPFLGLRSHSVTPVLNSLREVEDLTRFHPDGLDRGRRLVTSAPVSHVVAPTPKSRPVPFGISFANPDKVITCVRRKRRREVLFARGGAGSRKMRRPRFNSRSDVRC